jgi:N-methylhydantoinase B/oxoprolinase/acetone carboxylase alpha subunit
MNTPVEVLEMAFPLRVERYEINPDSGGAGRYRGGCGARRVWRLLPGADATASLCMERMTSPPFGLPAARPARLRRHPHDARRRHPASAEQGRLPRPGRLRRRT